MTMDTQGITVPGWRFWVHSSLCGEGLCQEANTDPALSSEAALRGALGCPGEMAVTLPAVGTQVRILSKLTSDLSYCGSGLELRSWKGPQKACSSMTFNPGYSLGSRNGGI